MGVATAPILTAGGTPGSFTVTASNGAGGPATYALTITAGSGVSLTLAGLMNAPAGAPQMLTVTVKDASGNTAVGYNGTVSVTSTDPQRCCPRTARSPTARAPSPSR